MKICVYGDYLTRPMTSTNLARGILRCLVSIRPLDSFVFYLHRGTERSETLRKWLSTLETPNWETQVGAWSSRYANLLGLLRCKRYSGVFGSADCYLSLDSDYMGPQSSSIHTVYDISAVKDPSRASMPWHGVQRRRFSLELLARSEQPVVAISEFTRRDLVDHDRRFGPRTTVIHAGIDSAWHDEPPTAQPALLERLGLKSPFWIWWGYVTNRKNVAGLVRAYALSVLRMKDQALPNLVLIGELGRDSTHLPRLICDLGISDRVRLIPFQPLEGLIELVRASSGLLFPSFYEGFGMPVVEAFALGKPVMTSNRTALPEVSGGLAILADPDNEQEMSAAILRTLERDQNSEEQQRLRKQWARQFTYERAALKYSTLITNSNLPTGLRSSD